MRCSVSGVALTCLAAGGRLEQVCYGNYYVAEIRRMLSETTTLRNGATAVQGLEEVYVLLR